MGLKAIGLICNLNYTCVDFYNYLKAKPKLLRQITANDKYKSSTTEADEDVELENAGDKD